MLFNSPLGKSNSNELITTQADLLGSLLHFTRVFYQLRTGREFVIDRPVGRESPQITICRNLMAAFNGEIQHLDFNTPPGIGKSTLIEYFVAWATARYPDSNHIYVSCTKELAMEHTYEIREIMSLPYYRKLFGIRLSTDAQGHFKTEQGGTVHAAGGDGTIAGYNAGLPITDRYSGALLIDDIHKPNEVHTELSRETVKNNYLKVFSQRIRSPRVPTININHRLHQDDLSGNLAKGFDGNTWTRIILKNRDENNNILCSRVWSEEKLNNLKEFSPYVYAGQHQQDPIPEGGGIFEKDFFPNIDYDPDIFMTFLTCDTAETDKSQNDATVFSFWGLHYIKQWGEKTNILGIVWLDCLEIRILPKDLENEFRQFYINCMRYKIQPSYIAIEKKSTGVTLLSVLNQIQGLNLIEINRTKASGSKTTRYLEAQPYAAQKLIAFPKYCNHDYMCREHMRNITNNMSHKHDDIADTFYDAVKIGLIDKSFLSIYEQKARQNQTDETAKLLTSNYNKIQAVKNRLFR